MLTIIVAINLAISTLLLYLARRIWQIRQQLARTTDTLIAVERCTRVGLRRAPEVIYRRQSGIYQLRQANEPLQLQLQQLQQIVSVVVLGWQLWQRFSRSSKAMRSPLTRYILVRR